MPWRQNKKNKGSLPPYTQNWLEQQVKALTEHEHLLVFLWDALQDKQPGKVVAMPLQGWEPTAPLTGTSKQKASATGKAKAKGDTNTTKATGRGAQAARSAKKTHHYRLGTVTLWRICNFQKSTESLIGKLPFNCLVHEVNQDVSPLGKTYYHFQSSAIRALQEVMEYFLMELFKEIQLA